MSYEHYDCLQQALARLQELRSAGRRAYVMQLSRYRFELRAWA